MDDRNAVSLSENIFHALLNETNRRENLAEFPKGARGSLESFVGKFWFLSALAW